MTEITPNQLELAREWARLVGPRAASDTGRSAAEVITALPDEWVNADELRGILTGIGNGVYEVGAGRGVSGIAEDLRALLPAPDPRKTLADMTPEEREACQWMQADFSDSSTGRTIRVVITRISPITADIILLGGIASCTYHGRLTPLPDLPRMVWPDEHYLTTDEDVSIIPPKIDTSTGHDDDVDMTPEDVPAEELWLVEFDGKRDVAVRELPGAERPWWLMRGWRASDEDVTLVSRLVPEAKA